MRSATRSLIALTGLLSLVAAAPAHAEFLSFDTSQSPFTPGYDNQGYHRSTGNRVANNDNYLVGWVQTSIVYRNFFTFDLSDLDPALNVVSARLEVRRAGSYPFGIPNTQTYQLFDVSTDAQTLNLTLLNDSAIFEDLGTGASYGTFDVPSGPSADTLTFNLNAAALTDIQAAAGGFFSIGGNIDLTGKDLTQDQALFVGSGSGTATNGIQRLVLEVTPIPEPGSLALLGLGALGVLLAARRKPADA